MSRLFKPFLEPGRSTHNPATGATWNQSKLSELPGRQGKKEKLFVHVVWSTNRPALLGEPNFILGIIVGWVYCSGSQPGATFPPKGHLAMSGDNFGCHNWAGEKECATGM